MTQTQEPLPPVPRRAFQTWSGDQRDRQMDPNETRRTVQGIC